MKRAVCGQPAFSRDMVCTSEIRIGKYDHRSQSCKIIQQKSRPKKMLEKIPNVYLVIVVMEEHYQLGTLLDGVFIPKGL